MEIEANRILAHQRLASEQSAWQSEEEEDLLRCLERYSTVALHWKSQNGTLLATCKLQLPLKVIQHI